MEPMKPTTTRRTVLKTSAGALALSVGATAGVAAKSSNAKSFGRVFANDTLWRTNVVKKLDEKPDPQDVLYFVNDGSGPAQTPSPFVSETAPGDQDYNGGKWVTYSAEVVDADAFADVAPLTSESDVVSAADDGVIELSEGRATNDDGEAFGPPAYFICPLNGRA